MYEKLRIYGHMYYGMSAILTFFAYSWCLNWGQQSQLAFWARKHIEDSPLVI